MAPMYYRGANAAILVYDITSEESFNDMSSWVEELRKNMAEDLMGNKLDLASTKRAVPLSRTQDYVARLLGPDSVVHEVSAKDDNGIEELFLQITRKLVERKQELEQANRLKAENAITLQHLENERLLQLQQAEDQSRRSTCCGI
ncbi:hypothetical protein BGW38_004443 [Lunasporangiospora selenospora]|uniref:Ras family protein n=1 Tax=Lunasporangiospora selenospora TaxID=979761 RepID=A0A9P6KC51_9FUNG|nr:hypothetical protein BGW38_004443 [Lunasporangiospora selenospora]